MGTRKRGVFASLPFSSLQALRVGRGGASLQPRLSPTREDRRDFATIRNRTRTTHDSPQGEDRTRSFAADSNRDQLIGGSAPSARAQSVFFRGGGSIGPAARRDRRLDARAASRPAPPIRQPDSAPRRHGSGDPTGNEMTHLSGPKDSLSGRRAGASPFSDGPASPRSAGIEKRRPRDVAPRRAGGATVTPPILAVSPRTGEGFHDTRVGVSKGDVDPASAARSPPPPDQDRGTRRSEVREKRRTGPDTSRARWGRRPATGRR